MDMRIPRPSEALGRYFTVYIYQVYDAKQGETEKQGKEDPCQEPRSMGFQNAKAGLLRRGTQLFPLGGLARRQRHAQRQGLVTFTSSAGTSPVIFMCVRAGRLCCSFTLKTTETLSPFSHFPR